MTNKEQSTGHKRVLQGKVVSNKPAGGKTVVGGSRTSSFASQV